MARFFFHLRTDRGLEPDDEGLEYPDMDRACREAALAIPGLTREFLAAGRDPTNFCFQISDADGNVLCEVPFRPQPD